MLPNYTETDLFTRLSDDDEYAFGVIFDRYWPQVYGTSLHLTKQPELARDLSQDIFVKLWENRGKLKNVINPASYIFILSKNLITDYLRKKVFNAENIDYLIQYFQYATAGLQEHIEYRELETLLNKAINSLTGKVKEVFVLSRKEGLTHEQIAERLGISVVSSKTYVVRALQHIRKFMDTHADEKLLVVFLSLLTL